MPMSAGPDDNASVPEPGPEPEPVFEESERPAPEVVDSPQRNTEF